MTIRQLAAGFVLALFLSLPVFAQANPAPTHNTPPPPNGQQPSATVNQQNARQAPSENPLNLSEEQKAKLRPILVEEHQQLDTVRSDTSLRQEEKIQRASDIRSEAAMKIRAVLTPEQFQKLLALDEQDGQEPPHPSSPPATAAPTAK